MMKNGTAGVDFLKSVPLFADLSEVELAFLAERVCRREYEPGTLIFCEDDRCDGLYVIEMGEVKVFKTSPSGRERVLMIFGAGSSLAELPIFDDAPYPASAAAVTGAALLHINKKDIYELCRQHPDVALKILRVMGSRLRKLVEIIEELSFKSVRHRLAALLYRMADSKGHATRGGTEFTLPCTQEELAAQVGTVRELVSRNLRRLQILGVLRLKGKLVIVTDLTALRAEAKRWE
jgi:CRP/FNR family cyclic AMP-dependent transcriptional regulator